MLGLTFSRRLAILSGIALPIVETARRWRDWPGPIEQWPFWLDDYVVGVLLIVAALASWRTRRNAAWLTAAWGVATGLMLGSTLAQYGHIVNPELGDDPSGVAHEWVLLAKIGILTVCALGLVTSMRRDEGDSITR